MDCFGLASIQAGALSSAFIALGKPPEVAATSINALLLKLKTADKQGTKFQKALQGIGLDATELKKSVDEDAQGALNNFLQTLSKVDKTEQMGVLSDLFGAEYSDDIALLVGGLENYNKALNLTSDATKYQKRPFRISCQHPIVPEIVS
ncbi:MAG: phage tail tape measure protein [Campylobacterales bacterium]|nr:phage tail tape measure protein [Campylobacterales bacterium]